MRTTISKEVQFDAGHRVPDHGSKCRNPHGHRYRIVVTVGGEVVDEAGAADNGMVVDFGDLKQWMTDLVHDRWDHGFIVYDGDPFAALLLEWVVSGDLGARVIAEPWIPTAENMARAIAQILEPVITEHWRGNLELERVEVWETPTGCAAVDL